jgi:hypothetical protein
MTSRNSITRELRVRLAGARKKTIARRLRAVAPRLQLAESGDAADFVMLPSEDYERLLDEADERSAKMAFERTRDEEFVPLEIADHLLKPENPVHVWRGHRGLTLAQLGERRLEQGLPVRYRKRQAKRHCRYVARHRQGT